MRKFLIVAGLVFILATVFGRSQISVGIEEFPAVNQSNDIVQISSTKKNEGEPCNSVRRSRILTALKDKCFELFVRAQSELKKNKWLSRNAKLLYSTLKFDDVWKQIEAVLLSASLNKADKKYVDLRKTVTDNAKIFYKQVLGNSELGQTLYKKAAEVIDSAKCIQCSNLKLARDSSFVRGDKVVCGYYSADDFLAVLVHETGHVLEYFYRNIKKLPQSMNQQREYVSTFFETLLEASNFRGKLYSQNFSLHDCRLLELYVDLLYKSFISWVESLYDENTLLDLYQLLNVYEQGRNIELDKIVNELRYNPKTKLFIDMVCDLENIGMFSSPDYRGFDKQKQEIVWQKCLQSLDRVQGYDDLKQFLHDADIGKGIIFNKVQLMNGKVCKLFMEDQEIKEIVLPPELKGIDWDEIFSLTAYRGPNRIVFLLKAYIDKACDMKVLDSLHLWRFLSNSIIQKFLLGFGRMISHLGILNKKYLKFLENFVDDIWSIQNIDNHIAGKYNAFRLIKEKGYLDILEKGKSLPIEGVMSELTKPLNFSKLTKESAEEFLNFLKK